MPTALELAGHLLADLRGDRLPALAAALEELVHLGPGVVALELAVLDQLGDQLLGLGPGQVGEGDAGVEIPLESVLLRPFVQPTWSACWQQALSDSRSGPRQESHQGDEVGRPAGRPARRRPSAPGGGHARVDQAERDAQALGQPAVGAGLVPDHHHRPVPRGEGEALLHETRPWARCGLPAISGVTPEAVATAASSAPDPGIRPSGVGWVGSSLVAISRPESRAAVAVAAREAKSKERLQPTTAASRRAVGHGRPPPPRPGAPGSRGPRLRPAPVPADPGSSSEATAGGRRGQVVRSSLDADPVQAAEQLAGGGSGVVGGEHDPDAVGPQGGHRPEPRHRWVPRRATPRRRGRRSTGRPRQRWWYGALPAGHSGSWSVAPGSPAVDAVRPVAPPSGPAGGGGQLVGRLEGPGDEAREVGQAARRRPCSRDQGGRLAVGSGRPQLGSGRVIRARRPPVGHSGRRSAPR